MTAEDWSDPERRAVGLLLAGDEIDGKTDLGHPLADDTFFLALNASDAASKFTVPQSTSGANSMGRHEAGRRNGTPAQCQMVLTTNAARMFRV